MSGTVPPTPDGDATDQSGAKVGPYTMTGDNDLNNQYTSAPGQVLGYDASGNLILRADPPGADFNGNYSTSVEDYFAFIAAWHALLPSADINGSGEVTVQDIFDFMALWFGGNGTTRKHEHSTYDYKNRLIQLDRLDGAAPISQALFTYNTDSVHKARWAYSHRQTLRSRSGVRER